MILQILRTKIQALTVNESNSAYPGSISLSEELLKASGIKQFELVHVNNKTNGNRILTYAVKNKLKGYVTINGAASKLFQKGDVVHVMAFASLSEKEIEAFVPTLVITDKENTVLETKNYVFD